MKSRRFCLRETLLIEVTIRGASFRIFDSDQEVAILRRTRARAGERAALPMRSIAPRQSLRLHAGVLDDLGPSGAVALEPRRGLRGAAHQRDIAEHVEPLPDLGIRH